MKESEPKKRRSLRRFFHAVNEFYYYEENVNGKHKYLQILENML